MAIRLLEYEEILIKRDLIHHKSEQCEFRKLKCHSCGEITKTLANMEKRMANMETKMLPQEETGNGILDCSFENDVYRLRFTLL